METLRSRLRLNTVSVSKSYVYKNVEAEMDLPQNVRKCMG